MRRFHQTTPTRSCIVIALIASLLLTIGCSSLEPLMQEEGSFERTAEKLAVSGDCVVAMKTGEKHRFVLQKAEIITVDGTRWIKGAMDSLRLPMAEVKSITPDRNLMIALGDTAIVEFPAGRWKFLIENGSLSSITGAGTSIGNMTGLQRGNFTVALSRISEMTVRETDTVATIRLVLGIGLLGLLVAGLSGAYSMNLKFGWGK